MNTVYYECYETGAITEIHDYPAVQSLFCTEKIYGKLYAEELPRFMKNPANIYALPYHENPEKIYCGAGRMGIGEISDIEESVMFSEQEMLDYMKLCENHGDYELIFVRLNGSDSEIPQGYAFIGYDIAYPPEADGGFSIICDCMFICKWHGCDCEGTEFAEDFARLNSSGLFSSHQDAYNYMVHYLNQSWSERGVFGIYEIYSKNIAEST